MSTTSGKYLSLTGKEINNLGAFMTKNAVMIVQERIEEMESGRAKLHLTAPPSIDPDTGDTLCYVKAASIPMNLSLNPNSRNSVITGPISREIRDSFEKEGERVRLRSNGMTIIADRIFWDPSNPLELVLTFRAVDDQGIVDGGTTYGNLRIVRTVVDSIYSALKNHPDVDGYQEAMQAHESLGRAKIRVEVLQRLSSQDAQDVSYSRNRNNKQGSENLPNLQGKFEFIKHALGGDESFVKFYQGQDQEQGGQNRFRDVSDLVRHVIIFSDFDSRRHATSVYGGSFMNSFLENFDSKSYLRATKVLPDILKLEEDIHFFLGKESHDDMPGIELSSKKIYLPFTDREVEYKVPDPYIRPILAGFRLLLDPNTGEWVTDPRDFFKRHRVRLVEAVRKALAWAKRNDVKSVNPSAFGKKDYAWEKVVTEVLYFMSKEGLRAPETDEEAA